MTLTEADELIAQWGDKQKLIEQNLRSFTELPAFERCCDRTPGDELAEKVTGTFSMLRAYQAALDGVIEQAKQLRGGIARIMPSRPTLAEIERLLRGNSIRLASSPTPPQRRELLRDVEQAEFVSPARLLEIMLDSFRFVRDSVLEVEAAELQAAEQHQQVQSRLAEAQARMTMVQAEHDRAKKSVADRQLKVDAAVQAALPSSEEELAALDRWLGKLAATVARAEAGPASVGLAGWMDAAGELLARDRRCADANEALLHERRELRGLFGALEAKSAGSGKSADAQLAMLGEQIKQLFARRPTPMAQVRELVSRYHRGVG
jgi:hypothetical protein